MVSAVPDGIEGEAVMPTAINAGVQHALSSEGGLAVLVTVVIEIGAVRLPKLSLSVEGAEQFRGLLDRAIGQARSVLAEGSE